jgi:hypothetical protein
MNSVHVLAVDRHTYAYCVGSKLLSDVIALFYVHKSILKPDRILFR